MRIVLTTPDGLTKTSVIDSLGQARRHFRTSWVRPPTDEELQAVAEAVGIPARIVVETPMPTIDEFGERAVAEDVRQSDGTWLQTWTVEETVTLAEAKAQLRDMAIGIYWQKVQIRVPTGQEVTDHAADPVPIIAARVTKYRPKLNNVRQQIQAATTVAECWALYEQMRDDEI